MIKTLSGHSLVAFSGAQNGISLTDGKFKPNTDAVIIITFTTCHKHFSCLYVVSPVGGLTEVQHTARKTRTCSVQVQSHGHSWILESSVTTIDVLCEGFLSHRLHI